MLTTLWNAIRVPVAFLVAPLAPLMLLAPIWSPLIIAVLFYPDAADPILPLFGFFFIVPSLIAYLIMLVIGVPLYRILLKLKKTEFWIAPSAGFGIALLIARPDRPRRSAEL